MAPMVVMGAPVPAGTVMMGAAAPGSAMVPKGVGGEAGQTLAKCFEQSCTEKMTLWTLWQQVSQSSYQQSQLTAVSLNFAFTPG